MNGEKYGKYLVAVILLIAAGTMVSASFAHYEAEKDTALEESYYKGMAEMHNSMMGTSLSVDEIILLHEENECLLFPNLGKY